MHSPNDIYLDLIKTYTAKLKQLSRQLLFWSFVRLGLFISIFIVLFILLPVNSSLAYGAAFILLVAFLISIKYYLKISDTKKYIGYKLEINVSESEALENIFSQFDSGDEYIDPKHNYSYDLDIFGKGSLFQYINRSVTHGGKQVFANMLCNPLLNSNRIVERQKIIAELAPCIKWRQDFAARGRMFMHQSESGYFKNWAQKNYRLKSQKMALPLVILISLFAIFSLVYSIFTSNTALLFFAITAQFIYWIFENRSIKTAYNDFGKHVQLLKKYVYMFGLIENFDWKSDSGKKMYQQFTQNQNPSTEIKKLERIVSAFDSRNNFLVGIFLNLLFAWDILCTYRIVNWYRLNKHNVTRWAETLSYVDALNCFANFSYNHPEYCFPQILSESFLFDAKKMGHPLIHSNKRIVNDFNFDRNKKVLIVTGANMAGKSTFLRTVGVNSVLAMCGAPVCAQKMSFAPVELFSNMRTTDSLFNDESYFFAELKRLKAILDQIAEEKNMLIILDEILKGTNSLDKLSGSQKLIKRLINSTSHSIIATHDIALTELESQYPETVENLCFEIQIDTDEMIFDYTLQKGVTSTMNASFLMKKMGIIE